MAKNCRHNCVGDGPCCLRGDLQHSLHVCSVAECECHTGERYGAKVVSVAHKPLTSLFIDMKKLMGGGSCATQTPPRKGKGICYPS